MESTSTTDPEPDVAGESRRSLLEYFIWGIFAFIGSVMAAILGAVATGPVFSRQRQDWLEVSTLENLTGVPQRFEVAYVQRQGWTAEERRQVVYAYLTPEGRVEILASVCTHLGCTVRWKAKADHFLCPCHGGTYDRKGRVIQGPPPRDLPHLPVKVERNTVLVQKA